MLCKHLARHLVARLPWLLARSQALRYARSPHVRLFAAQSFGFLLRQVAVDVPAAADGADAPPAPQPPPAQQQQQRAGKRKPAQQPQPQDAPAAAAAAGAMAVDGAAAEPAAGEEPLGAGAGGGSALRRAVRAVLAEQALLPSEQRTDGAGLLLAESVLGIGHGLHSRAPAVFELAFGEDLLTRTDLQGAGAAAHGAADCKRPRERSLCFLCSAPVFVRATRCSCLPPCVQG